MGQALAQNATDLAVSGPGELDLNALVAKVAARKSGGLTVSAATLDYNKLFSGVCAEFKSFSGIESKARLANEVVARIETAIKDYQSGLLNRFNEDLMGYRKFAAHKPSQSRFVMAETIRRESAMPLAEQHLFCNIAIGKATERLDKLVAKFADGEIVDKAKKALARLESTKASIEAAQSALKLT
jgi:hypothetical protein